MEKHSLRWKAFRSRAAATLVVFIGILAFSSLAGAAPYTLVPEDKIALRIVEWQPGEGRYIGWEAVEGTYGVNDAGALAIPIAGQVKAAGLTTDEVAKAIASALAEGTGLAFEPFVSAEIVQHAPIFVTGKITTPGRYSFEPGMTVLKAVSLAGGLERATDFDTASFERNRIQAAGDYRTALTTQRDLLMRRARLQAEIAGRETFAIPGAIADAPGIETGHAQELDLMLMRRVELESRRASTDDLISLYEQQIETLEAKMVSQDRQVAMARQELEAVSSLRDRGLTNNARQFGLDRALADAQSQLLDLEIALTKARQALEESKRDRADIVNTRNAENQQELNTLELVLRKTEVDMQVAQLLGEQAGYSAGAFEAMEANSIKGGARPRFEIVRGKKDGTPQTIAAEETTVLLPHDLVKVTLDLAQSLSPSVAGDDASAATGNESDTASGRVGAAVGL
ncbi:polysaccharide biosynthesis/export family protein [Aurantimonas coralicida]|uniref:polysaccharide biosynthesis/export family protein n=2 Tax=Alphaproteobacteria TaxID=28211 RepID=UPI00041C8933|nr:polysaccharide biosynthesis/export family protein [Aurantimonas coralicida]MCC4300127.1 polysaccharide biosynthesis/export family protein [Aurantimonas coralicida]MCW7546231.1 polysaccharide biosynthesis/export family protein [Aurantimonas litoralis]